MKTDYKFERYVYTADPHGSKLFVDFINRYDDNKTKFYVLGDLFDRGRYSFEIIEKIMELHKQGKGKLELVLGNHDLFFLFGFGLHFAGSGSIIHNLMIDKYGEGNKDLDSIWNTFYQQFYLNGGEETMKSFERGYGAENLKEKTIEILDFMWKFNLSLTDDLGGYLVHGGVPILDCGSIVGLEIDGEYVSGIDYVEKLNSKMKELDISTLEKLSAVHDEYGQQVYEGMKEHGAIIDEKISKYQINNYNTFMTPTWFANSVWKKDGPALVALREELDRKGMKRLFVGHWGNDSKDFANLNSKDSKNLETVVRLERCSVLISERYDEFLHFKVREYGNFGYCVLDSEGNIIEIGDAKDKLKTS